MHFGTRVTHAVEISTVDGFQGREKDIVIFSCVRAPPVGPEGGGGHSSASPGIGFLREPERLNVAITRAKFGLWIVGHGECLSNADSEWRNLVNYMTSNR